MVIVNMLIINRRLQRSDFKLDNNNKLRLNNEVKFLSLALRYKPVLLYMSTILYDKTLYMNTILHVSHVFMIYQNN